MINIKPNSVTEFWKDIASITHSSLEEKSNVPKDLMALLVQEQEPMKQKIDMSVDFLAYAMLKVSMMMDTDQRRMCVQSVGNNPALLKHSMERTMPGYFLDDFNLEKNDMERSFEFSFRAYGACQVDKKSRWIVTTGQKDADITQLTDHKYMMVYTDVASNIQQTQIIELPSEGKDISVETDAFGMTQFEFDMDATQGGMNYFFWGGILLCVVGGGWIVTELV